MRSGAAILILTLSAALSLRGQGSKPAVPENPVLQRPDYRLAVQALKDRLPEVAVNRLKKLLAAPPAKGASLAPVRLLLVEALVRSGKPDEALETATAADIRDLPEVAFWRGAALAKVQRFAAAEKELASLPAGFRYAAEATVTRASVLAALGQVPAALKLLQPVAESAETESSQRARVWMAELMLAAGRPGAEILAVLPANAQSRYAVPVRYLQARVALASGDAKAAGDAFAALAAGGRGVSLAIQHAATLGHARALQAGGQKAEALGVLEKLIGQSPPPETPVLRAAFEAFEQLNVPPGTEAEGFLKIWAASEHLNTRVLALLARSAAIEAAGRPADALAACLSIAKDAPQNELLPLALLRGARLALSTGNRQALAATAAQLDPIAASPAVKAWAAMLHGILAFDDQRFAAASEQFAKAARSGSTPDSKAAAAFNAAVSELQAGNEDPQAILALFDAIGGESARTAGAEFHLERALYKAGRGEADARDGLTAFVDALPDHPRRFEALVALAELSLTESPLVPAEIQKRLSAVAAAAKSPAEQEASAWLKVLAAEKTAPPDDYAREGAAFLTAWPASTRRAVLRMRLGEMQFRRGNYSAARQQFEQLAKDDPGHALAEAALFWAGKSALLTLGGKTSDDDAIAFWEAVYKKNGPLRLDARLQVALLKQRRNDFTAALQLLDGILDAKPGPDPNTRRQVVCARAEVLAGPAASPESVAKGLAAFDQIAGDPQMTPAWRHEALVRKGICLEQLKRTADAMEAWHTVLTDPAPADSDDYWYHRAGEKILRILESRHEYDAAVTIAEKLAKAPGERGRAAAELVNQLVLKHGIWRDLNPPK